MARGDGPVLAVGDCRDPAGGNALGEEIVARGIGAALAEGEVVGFSAAFIRVASDLYILFRGNSQPRRHMAEFLLRQARQIPFIKRKKYGCQWHCWRDWRSWWWRTTACGWPHNRHERCGGMCTAREAMGSSKAAAIRRLWDMAALGVDM